MLKAKAALFLLLYLCLVTSGNTSQLKDTPDPLLSLIFNTPDAISKQIDTRPDRSLSNEDDSKSNVHKAESSPERRSSETEGKQPKNAEELMSLVPSNNVPSSSAADFAAIPPPNASPAVAAMRQIPSIASASFRASAPLGVNDISGVVAQGKRATLMQPDSAQQSSLGPVDSNLDKKSQIPVMPALSAQSYPLQLNKISPNLQIRGVVPHVSEFGESVESMKTPEYKKSEIPKPDKLTTSFDNLMSSNKASGDIVKKSSIPSQPTNQQAPAPVAYFEIQQNQQNAYVTGPHYDVAQMQPQQAPQAQAFAPVPFQAAPQGFYPQEQRQNFPAQPQADQTHAAVQLPVNNDEPCADQYATCTDFAKNKYCENYPELMKIQCRKSCRYCQPKIDTSPVAAPSVNDASAKENIEESGDDSGSGSGDVTQASGDESSAAVVSNKVNTTQTADRKDTVASSSEESGSGEGSGSGDDGSAPDTPNEANAKAQSRPVTVQIGNSSITTPVLAINTNSQENTPDNSTSGVGKSEIDDEVSGESGSGQRANIPAPVNGTTNEESSGESDESGSEATEEEAASGNEATDAGAPQIVKKNRIPRRKIINVKKSDIPIPDITRKASSPYPRIDLKQIASALARYEQAALELAGEYPTSLESDYTRSRIPHPENLDMGRVNKMKQNIEVAKIITQGSQKRFDIPKYLLVGEKIHEKGGVVESNVVTADSIQSVEERFQIPGVIPNLNDYYAETGKTSFGGADASKKSKIDARRKKKKIQKSSDPYEYLRNMAPGASMEPIIDPHARSTIETHSYPLYLMKVMPGTHKYVEKGPARSKILSKPNQQAIPGVPSANGVPQMMQPVVAPAIPMPLPAPAVPMPLPAGMPAQIQSEGPFQTKTNDEIVAEQWKNFVERQRQAAAPANQATSDLRSKMLSAFFASRNAVAPGMGGGSGSGMMEGSGSDLNLRDSVLAPAGIQK